MLVVTSAADCRLHCRYTAAPRLPPASPLHHYNHHAEHECQEEAAQTGMLLMTSKTALFLLTEITQSQQSKDESFLFAQFSHGFVRL